jgi:hypothetical protein
MTDYTPDPADVEGVYLRLDPQMQAIELGAPASDDLYTRRDVKHVCMAAIDAGWLPKSEADALLARVERLEAALRVFTDHYPTGINPFLDGAYVRARSLLARLEVRGV